MPRLIDEIRGGKLAKPWFVPPHLEPDWEKHTQQIWAMLRDDTRIPVLLLDNVADYYYVSSDQETWNLEKDFPNLAPPFPVFWAEWRLPTKIHSKEKGDTDVSHLITHGHVGVMVTALDPRTQVTGEGITEDVCWILWCELFVDYGDRDYAAQGTHGAMFVAVDAHGAIIGQPWMQTYCGQEHGDMMKNLMVWLHPLFLAMSFLHCKNVTIVDNPVPPKLAKRYQERHGIWPAGYKTLVIEPLKAILRKEGHSDQVGIQRAMHICRGHFRDYREGRGLFGKYHQLVWQPMIVRGTKGGEPAPREIKVKV